MNPSFLRLGSYDVRGYGLKVGFAMDIRATDASGETSGTDEVDKGTKGKVLTVSLSIRFADADYLRELIKVSEAKTNGARTIYTIANTTANLAGVRQVRFTGRVSVEEQDGLRTWSVAFSLREYLSNPERVEQRETAVDTVTQTSSGTATEDATATAETAETVAVPESTLEKILAKLDKALE